MKAIVQDEYGSPDVLRLEEIDVPAVGANDVLVRVDAAGLDPGVWHLMNGLPYLVRIMGFGLRRPKLRVRGSDLAGRVETVGAAVTGFHPGDEVMGVGEGSFAEYAIAPPDKLVPKPQSLTFAQAAVVPISGLSALHAVRDIGKVRSGQRVMVIGAAGGVGSYAVQIAKASGAEVTGVCSSGKIELVRSIGADHVVDYTREDLGDGTRRYDMIVDTAGRRPLSRIRRVLAARGTLVIVGGDGGGRWLGGFDRQILRAPVLSVFSGQKLRGLISKETREDLERLTELIETGQVAPVIDRTYPLPEVPEAVRYLAEGHPAGKIAIHVSDAA
ncbi:MAG TPA: NAD(P)-dependent alcohol dehydrogenase [Actinomycetota bacterium]|nr:NAD(P)-dependent alcohol dehydrogenase [Actinomycetota bacterium]